MIYAILILIILLLINFIIMQNLKLKRISNIISEITGGSFNQRIRIQNHNKTIEELTANLNRLVEEFQKIIGLNKSYENERKQMISNISHDLRTPLTSMLGYIEVIKNDKNIKEEEKDQYLDIIERKCEALKALIDRFFELSKMESNDIKLNMAKQNICEIVRQNVVLFYNDFMTNNIEPIINVPDKDIYVNCDKDLVDRILNNLISNSLRYSVQGTKIGINILEKEDKIAVEVWDNGKGIPKEQIPYIFDRLYTLEKSRNNKFQGSGLGLTIAKKLVEKQGGEIFVESIPNEKTSFVFELPK